MKLLVLLIIIVSLLMIFRLCFPKRERQVDIPTPPKQVREEEAVIKIRYVLPDRRNSAQTSTTQMENEKLNEKPDIFASGNVEKNAVIPPDELDDVFRNEPNPEELDIEPDENEDSIEPDDEEPDNEEAEIMRKVAVDESGMASGLSIEELSEAFKATDRPEDKDAVLLYKIENTDAFEKLIFCDKGKAARIKAAIDRYVQSQTPEAESEEKGSKDNSDWKDFDMRNYLGKTNKK